MSRLLIKFSLRLALCVAIINTSSFAQKKTVANATSSCNQENALTILEEQIGATKTFDDQLQRIVVSIQAADLLRGFQ